MPDNNVSGTLYSYYFLCRRKVWLYYHKISFEHESELVAIGREVDTGTYTRERHQVLLDGLASVDYIKNNVVYEVKKSDSQQIMAINQLKYYLYLLREKGIVMTGQINYPLQKKTVEVMLNDEDVPVIQANLQGIADLVGCSVPPEAVNIRACYNCAYRDFCFS